MRRKRKAITEKQIANLKTMGAAYDLFIMTAPNSKLEEKAFAKLLSLADTMDELGSIASHINQWSGTLLSKRRFLMPLFQRSLELEARQGMMQP